MQSYVDINESYVIPPLSTNESVEPEHLRRLLRTIAPHSSPLLTMTRLGPDGDGGYVVPLEVIRRATVVITFGVGADVGFEAAVAKEAPSARFVFFDHTVPGLPSHAPPRSTFHKLGLAPVTSEGFVDMLAAWRMARVGDDDVVILKIDIEGHEWALFEAAAAFPWRRVGLLVMELHHLDDSHIWELADRAFQNTVGDGRFVGIHVHGNNVGQCRVVNETHMRYMLPGTLEITMINSAMWFQPRIWAHAAPTPVDRQTVTLARFPDGSVHRMGEVAFRWW